jgi:hypothetical protein
MIIITTALCLFCGWLGYELGKADGHAQGFIDGCREREEYEIETIAGRQCVVETPKVSPYQKNR